MSETTESGTEAHDLFELLNHGLDEVRARIDELLVRLDIGRMNVRGEVRDQLDRSVNALLAAKSKLEQAGHDLGASADGVGEGLREVAHDVKAAIDATTGAVTRK